MAEKNYRKLTISNMLWQTLERIGAQGVTFVVSIILARLLDPSDYATVSLVTVFTSLLSIFISSGVSSALIQKKDADDLDFSSMFYFNIVMCLTLYGVMYFAAPAIASFYGKPELVALTRVSSLTLIISGVKGVQSTYVSKKLMFKKFFFATLGGTICAAFVGIFMAYKGYGCWALVIQSLINHTIDTIVLWFTVKWRPKWMFSFKRLGESLNFGWKILAVVFINRLYENARTLIIGKKYTSNDLAFFNKGSGFPSTINEFVTNSIDVVMFPVLSMEQDNKEKMKAMVSRGIKTSTYIMMPMMMGLAVCAEPIVRVLLTEKWIPMVFYLRVFCYTYAFSAMESINLSAIKALGRSDVMLKLEIIKKVLGLGIIATTMFISVKAMALGLVINSIAVQIINSWPNKKLFDYSFFDQIKDIFPQILLTCVMGFCVYMISFAPFNDFCILGLQIITGVIVYVVGSIFMKIDSFVYVKDILADYKSKIEK